MLYHWCPDVTLLLFPARSFLVVNLSEGKLLVGLFVVDHVSAREMPFLCVWNGLELGG